MNYLHESILFSKFRKATSELLKSNPFVRLGSGGNLKIWEMLKQDNRGHKNCFDALEGMDKQLTSVNNCLSMFWYYKVKRNEWAIPGDINQFEIKSSNTCQL